MNDFTITNGHTGISRSNSGSFGTASSTPLRDWRDKAMSRALNFASDEGSPLYVMLDAARRYADPQMSAHRTFYEKRDGAVNAFRERLAEVHTLLHPAQHQKDEESGDLFSPIYGWWRGHDPITGAAYELVMCPACYETASFLLLGPDHASVAALVTGIMNDVRRHRCRCRRFGGEWEDDPEMEAEVAKVSWEDIVLASETLTDVRRTIEQFFAQRETFAKMSFPWRRGVLLVGPPGTGKTMVCKAAANSFPHLPFLYVGDIGRRNCIAEIEAVFAHARKSAPCILAFEDMDGMVDRANRTVFLNELDGFRDNEGLLIIASSNHPERIDEALLKRPSRFDRVYHIGLPAREERAEYARRLIERSPNLSSRLDAVDLAGRVADATEGFTPAFLKEAFLSATLQMVYEGLTELDETFGAAVLEQVDLLRRYLKKARNPEALAEMVSGTGAEAIGFRSR